MAKLLLFCLLYVFSLNWKNNEPTSSEGKFLLVNKIPYHKNILQTHANARMRNARAETALDVAARLGKANVCRLLICNCPELALQVRLEDVNVIT